MASSNIVITQRITGVALATPLAVEPEEVIVTDVKLPEDAPARVKTLRSEGRKWYLTITYHPDTNKPFALFCYTNHKEKSVLTEDVVDRLNDLARSKGIPEAHINTNIDKCAAEPNVGKLTRTISLLLRHGVAIRHIVAVLDATPSITVGSFVFQLKKFLSQYIKNGEVVESETCPSCGGTLIFSEGCMTCRDCGTSKCS